MVIRTLILYLLAIIMPFAGHASSCADLFSVPSKRPAIDKETLNSFRQIMEDLGGFERKMQLPLDFVSSYSTFKQSHPSSHFTQLNYAHTAEQIYVVRFFKSTIREEFLSYMAVQYFLGTLGLAPKVRGFLPAEGVYGKTYGVGLVMEEIPNAGVSKINRSVYRHLKLPAPIREIGEALNELRIQVPEPQFLQNTLQGSYIFDFEEAIVYDQNGQPYLRQYLQGTAYEHYYGQRTWIPNWFSQDDS